jgi:integrase
LLQETLRGFRLRFRTARRATSCSSRLRGAGIDQERPGGRGIGIHSLRETAIADAIRSGAARHEVRECGGHSDIRTTELYLVGKKGAAAPAPPRLALAPTQ